MIEIFSMRAEKIERLQPKEIEGSKSPAWIRCVDPSERDIEAISGVTGIPAEELKGSLEESERSKVSVNKHIEIVYASPMLKDEEIITVPVFIYALNNVITTIERNPTKVLTEMSAALLDNKRRFLFKKPAGYFIYYLLDKINDEFLYFIDKVSVKIDLFKERGALSRENIERVYDTSIALSYFNQALIANIEVLNELRKSYYKMFEQDDRKNFSDLYYDALQILDTERIQRELLTNLFNMQSIITGNKLNRFMKGVAFFALIITIPTLITNIYGMNLPNMPLADNPYAFYMILGFMTAVSMIIYYIYLRTSEK